MPWRPQIPDELESKIEAVAEPAGYQSKSELVRDAVRRKVEELHSEKPPVEEVDSKEEIASVNLKEVALDRGKGRVERREAVSRLGDIGEVALDSLSEVAKDAGDSHSHKMGDNDATASGDDIRKRARKEIEDITNG